MIAIRTFAVIALMSAGLTAFVHPLPPNSANGLRRHTHLVKSAPASNDTLAKSPGAIRLWFTEPVELAVTTVKLADGAGGLVALGPLARPDTGQAAPVVAPVKRPLPPGNYVVTWSTAAKDGHPASGTFGFVVKAAR
jgi:methionine-rich copper-binding protein CopC